MKDTAREAIATLVDQYIREAEHQNGSEYWLRFPNARAAAFDMAEYIRGVLEGSDPDLNQLN